MEYKVKGLRTRRVVLDGEGAAFLVAQNGVIKSATAAMDWAKHMTVANLVQWCRAHRLRLWARQSERCEWTRVL